MASIVGVYYAFYQKTVTPDVFAGTISLKILMVCIVGGIGNGCCVGHHDWLFFNEKYAGVLPAAGGEKKSAGHFHADGTFHAGGEDEE